jgi:hypothetical protein
MIDKIDSIYSKYYQDLTLENALKDMDTNNVD